MITLPNIHVRRLRGDEPVSLPPSFEPSTVAAFWSWACSDVLSNTLRGLFAEWLVATALGLTGGQRWGAL